MLSKEKIFENKTYEICKNSGDINVGDHFKGILIKDDLCELSKKSCTCIGKINDNERFFLSDDMLCYFSVTDGWGEYNGYLAALNKGVFLRFNTPTDLDGVRELIKNPPPAKSMYGNILRHAEITAAEKIIEAVENG